MRLFSLMALMVLGIVSSAFAADPAGKIKATQTIIPKKELAVDAKKFKPANYDLDVKGTINGTALGQWGYSLYIFNQSRTAPIAPNTLEVVVVRKLRDGAGETVLNTHPLPALSPRTNYKISDIQFPVCWRYEGLEARVREKGANVIGAKGPVRWTIGPNIHTVYEFSEKSISNNGTYYRVKIKQVNSHFIAATTELTVTRGGKNVVLAKKDVILRPGTTYLEGPTAKINENERATLKVYAKTGCPTDLPENLRMAQTNLP